MVPSRVGHALSGTSSCDATTTLVGVGAGLALALTLGDAVGTTVGATGGVLSGVVVAAAVAVGGTTVTVAAGERVGITVAVGEATGGGVALELAMGDAVAAGVAATAATAGLLPCAAAVGSAIVLNRITTVAINTASSGKHATPNKRRKRCMAGLCAPRNSSRATSSTINNTLRIKATELVKIVRSVDIFFT